MTKTFTFAIIHFTIAFFVTYLLTGSILIGGAVAIIEPSVNTVAFYLHEKVWKSIEQKNSNSTLHHLLAKLSTSKHDSLLFEHHRHMHISLSEKAN